MPYKKLADRRAYLKSYNKERSKRDSRIRKALKEGNFQKAKQILKEKIIVTPGLVAA